MLPGASRYIHFFVRVIDHPARANRHGIFSPGFYLPLTIRKIFRAKNIGSSDLQVFVNRPRWQRAGEGVFPMLDFGVVNLGCAAACAASGHGANLNHQTRNTQAREHHRTQRL